MWFFSKKQTAPMTTTGAQYEKANTNSVTFNTAMSVSAFYACVKVISETISSLPIQCYETNSELKRKNTDYPLFKLLRYKPNRYQTSLEFFEQILLNLVTDGNAYVRIHKDQRGTIYSLIVINSGNMSVELTKTGALLYHETKADGSKETHPEMNVWHIKLGGDGITGLSPLAHASQSLNISTQLEKRTNNIANNGKISGVVQTDQILTTEQRTAMKKNVVDSIANSEGVHLLEAGMKWEAIGLSPQDQQILETRKYQVDEIATFMRVPKPILTGEKVSDELMQSFYKLTLRPYIERIEASIERHLMPMSDLGKYQIQFDFDALLRADKATRIQTYSTAIQTGQLKPNEARSLEGMEPVEGGDTLVMNGALLPLNSQDNKLNSKSESAGRE